MSIRDLIARSQGTAPKLPATPAQAHVRMCLEGGRAALRADNEPAGWEHLGSGYFSSVFGVDAMTAVKVGPRLDGGYVFAMWALQNQDLEGVPRIYAVQRVSTPPGEYSDGGEGYIVVMERLQSAKQGQWGSVVGNAQWQLDQVRRAKYSDALSEDDLDAERPECAAFKAMRALRRHLMTVTKYDDPYFDVHSGNVMLRGDVLVLIDPLAGMGEMKDRGKYARKRYERVLRNCGSY